MNQEYFIRNSLISSEVITVVSVEFQQTVNNRLELVNTERKKFTFDNNEEMWLERKDRYYNLKPGEKLKKEVYSTIYTPTGRLSYIQEVQYLPCT